MLLEAGRLSVFSQAIFPPLLHKSLPSVNCSLRHLCCPPCSLYLPSAASAAQHSTAQEVHHIH